MISTKIQTTVTVENHRAGNGGDVTASIDTEDPKSQTSCRWRRRGLSRGGRRPRRARDRQAACAGLDPRLRGGGLLHRGRHAGVGVLGAGGDTGRARDTDLHADDRGHVRRQRRLPPGDLEVGDGAQVDEARRPLDDLRLHRGQLHAVRPAGAAVGEGHGAVLDRLERGGRGRAAQDVLAVGAALGGRAALPAAGLGRGVVRRAHPARRRGGGPGLADRRRRAVQHRRRVVRAEVAQPVACDFRTPRVLPRLHGGGGHLPLHRHVVRRLQQAISARWQT